MTLKKNILANYAGASVLALAPLLALPWYLATLGAKQFGLIGLIAMLQALLGLLDAGLSQALVREVAQRLSSVADGRQRSANLLLGFERLYWAFGLLAGTALALLAKPIAQRWVHLDGLASALGEQAVYGAAAIFASQFAGSVYRSVLVGAQTQVTLNAVMISAALLRHGAGVALVLYWPSLQTYLFWQIGTALLETLVRRHFAWQVLGVARAQAICDWPELRATLRWVASLSGAAWLGALTVQMDKIVLSRVATIEQFGYYSLASVAALGALQLVYPLVQASLPQAVTLRDDALALRRLLLRLLRWTALLAGVGLVVFFVAGATLLRWWLHDQQAASAVYPLLSVLLLGSVLNAFYNVGYIYWLAKAQYQRVLQVNVLSLIASLVLIPLLVNWLGTVGAAAGWLSINLLGFLFSLEWFYRHDPRFLS